MLERFWNFYNIHYYRNFHKVLATHFIYELDKLNIWNSFYTCFCWLSLKCTQHKNLRSKSTLTLQAPTLEKGQHSQTIRRLLPTNCSSVFDHFVGLAFKVLNKKEHRPCFANTMLLCILAQFFFCFDTKQNLSKHYKVQYLPKSWTYLWNQKYFSKPQLMRCALLWWSICSIILSEFTH